MKYVFMLLFLSTISCATVRAQWRFGPEAGLNESNIRQSVQGLYSPNNLLPGLKAGALADYEYNDHLALQLGAFYAAAGCITPGSNTYSYGQTIIVPNITQTLNYIQVPVQLVYKAGLGSGRVFVGGGAYVGWALSGSIKKEAYSIGAYAAPTITTTDKFGSDTASYKALDYGLQVLAGYEFPRGFFIKGAYSYGLCNYSNLSSKTLNNTCIYIGIGYLFGGQFYR
jgi:hypothetical protein